MHCNITYYSPFHAPSANNQRGDRERQRPSRRRGAAAIIGRQRRRRDTREAGIRPRCFASRPAIHIKHSKWWECEVRLSSHAGWAYLVAEVLSSNTRKSRIRLLRIGVNTTEVHEYRPPRLATHIPNFMLHALSILRARIPCHTIQRAVRQWHSSTDNV